MLIPERAGDAVRPAVVRRRIADIEPWECEVDVYLQPPKSKPPFHLKTCMELDGDERIILRNRGRPGFIIKFRLRNELNRRYRFPKNPLDAIWSQLGYECPEVPMWEIFRPFAVDKARMILRVYAENPSPRRGDFEYALRVRNNHGKLLKLDPGGTENNGAGH